MSSATELRTRGSSRDAMSTPPAEMRLLVELFGVFVERIQAAVVEVLEGQTRPAELLTDQRLSSEVLGISVRTLRDELLPAGLPHLLVSGMRRYDVGEVLAWLRARRESGEPSPSK